MKLGDFTQLAESYSKSRPGYSEIVLENLLSIQNYPIEKLKICDLGAGTGIWSRMIYEKVLNRIVAIEPNSEMIKFGKINNKELDWIQATAENIPIKNQKFHWITMASSFHWTKFDDALDEFNRILIKGGCFTALWNPRVVEETEKLYEVELWLKDNLKTPRVSSGNSEFTSKLESRFKARNDFSNFKYLEARHSRIIDKKMYLETWKSVNDIRAQLGVDKFNNFLNFIDNLFLDNELIVNNYVTKAWTIFKNV